MTDTTESPRKVQVVCDPLTLARVERLKAATGRATFADVVRDALALYDWTRACHADGFAVSAAKGNHVREFALNFQEPKR